MKLKYLILAFILVDIVVLSIATTNQIFAEQAVPISPSRKSIILGDNDVSTNSISTKSMSDSLDVTCEGCDEPDEAIEKVDYDNTETVVEINENTEIRNKCYKELGDSGVYADCSEIERIDGDKEKTIVKENVEVKDKCYREIGDSNVYTSCDEDDSDEVVDKEVEDDADNLDENTLDEDVNIYDDEDLPTTGPALNVILGGIGISLLIYFGHKYAKGFRRKRYETL